MTDEKGSTNDVSKVANEAGDAGVADSATTVARRSPTWIIATVAGLFGLFYAYAVWNALDFLIKQATGVFGLNGLGWLVLGLAVVFPLIVFALTVSLGHKRRIGDFTLMLLTGLALVAVFWLSVVAYTEVNGASLLNL